MLFSLVAVVTAQQPVDKIALVQGEATSQGLALRFSDRVYGETQIYRRQLGTISEWEDEELVADLGQESRWFDTEIEPGNRWEYFIERDGDVKGFLAGAIDGEVLDNPGKIALVIEESVLGPLEPEIEQLRTDLIAEGWSVVSFEVAKTDSVVDVKALLQGEPDLVSAMLIGHVPVPYSGAINPDGHSDHYGAWPADTFYGDLSEQWTDETRDVSSGSRAQNHNTPGDGKFDQNNIPSDVDLEVGRIDMFDLPAFEESEVELLRRYFERNHAWRTGQIDAEPAVVIDDNFGTYAPGSYSAWLLSSVVGRENLEEGDFLETLTESPYLFGFGSGAGNYSRAQGVAKTQQFAEMEIKGVFLMLFGSYFGDFDSTDNLLRASIAGEGNALTAVWAGRPVHRHHAMGIGHTVGFAVRHTQNAREMMVSNYNTRKVHVALLGDPTLRAFPFQSGGPVSAVSDGEQGEVALSWEVSSATDVVGYHVYRSDSEDGPFVRITVDPTPENMYQDRVEAEGQWWWMVRAIRVEETASGSFFNPSAGQIASLEVTIEPVDTSSYLDTGEAGSTDTGHEEPEENSSCACSNQGPLDHKLGMGFMAILISLGSRRRRK
jgi:hypothetical protein